LARFSYGSGVILIPALITAVLNGKMQNQAQTMSLESWQREVGSLVMRRSHSFTEEYPAPPKGVTPEDCKALGFEFYNQRRAYNFLDGAAKSAVYIDFSPDLRHQAVMIRREGDWAGGLLWVDAHPVPVPRREDGNPLCDRFATWIDDRFVYLYIGGIWDHPLFDPSTFDPLGNIRGLLIWDALKLVRYIELPEPGQNWDIPFLCPCGDSWRIYSDREAHHPDRVLPIPV
jgi:hypothetical protein